MSIDFPADRAQTSFEAISLDCCSYGTADNEGKPPITITTDANP